MGDLSSPWLLITRLPYCNIALLAARPSFILAEPPIATYISIEKTGRFVKLLFFSSQHHRTGAEKQECARVGYQNYSSNTGFSKVLWELMLSKCQRKFIALLRYAQVDMGLLKRLIKHALQPTKSLFIAIFRHTRLIFQRAIRCFLDVPNRLEDKFLDFRHLIW